MNKEKKMAEDGQSKKLKHAPKAISRWDWIDKNQVEIDKPTEISPPPVKTGPILLSQLLEFDWDECFIPVSLASINYPVLSFQFRSARAQAAVSQNTIGIRPSTSKEKKYSTRKY